MTLDDAVERAVTRAVEACVDRLLRLSELDRATPDHQQLYPEAQAASICGISATMLKEMRLAGRITPWRRARPILYTREQLQDIAELLRD